MMDTIILKAINHRQQECIGIYFSNVTVLNEAVKKLTGSHWTKTFKCWQMPLSKDAYLLIASAFKEIATIDNTALRAYLIEKKKTTAVDKITSPKVANQYPIKAPVLQQAKSIRRQTKLKKPIVIHPINAHIIPKMKELMVLKGYSDETEKTYLNEMRQFLQLLGNQKADDFTPDRLKKYLVYCFEVLKHSDNTIHSRINSFYPVGLKN